MPNVPVRRVAILLAMAKSQELGREVAIYFTNQGLIRASGVDDSQSPFDPPSPIINMLQNEHAMASIGRPRNTDFIAVSSRPTEKTLGMIVLVQGAPVPVLYFDPAAPITGNPVIFVYSFDINTKTWTSRAETAVPLLTPNENYNFTQAALAVVNELIVNPTKAGALTWMNALAPNVLDRRAGPALTSPQTILTTLTLTNLADAPRAPTPAFPADQLRILCRRRITFPAFTLPANLVPGPGRADTLDRHNIFMRLSWAILQAGGFWRTQAGPGDPNRAGHNIGGVLRGPNDEIIAWGLNTNTGDFSQHGEVNLLEYFYRLPANQLNSLNGNILYTTLEPCHMCSGMYADVGNNMDCRYGQDDDTSENSALRRGTRGSTVRLHPTRIGTEVIDSFTRYRTGVHGGRVNIVDYLNGGFIALILQYAFDAYIDLRPGLVNAGDISVWENGLRLLHHIDPNVNARWQARHDHFYPGVIP